MPLTAHITFVEPESVGTIMPTPGKTLIDGGSGIFLGVPFFGASGHRQETAWSSTVMDGPKLGVMLSPEGLRGGGVEGVRVDVWGVDTP